eukprot:CAMPEP_0172533566 /NCGR_PEP_ID=MMETSP1067-20121228/6221_1 /TAXON_ID=265564 ORGANISM="Thalassiosira punctigera, Strain Tpunct2005C2" /NCGR_SAMPLE_ID=MMETSP1067 /ASSEMBLY_ACC=CAM_ASM_000444 /LENGTH=622 /DNA_ID=CAMNT_0013318219 /DNA_START=88 /DNA_END=1956 /DNA_ORIENTATION=+
MAGTGRGRGRGGKKRARTRDEALPAAPLGAAAAEEASAVPANLNHVARSMLLTTPLGALMRIEATIWMNARGAGRMSLDDFYALARTHEWLGLMNQKSIANGGKDEAKMAPTMVPKKVSDLSRDVYELINQLSEEERLLFDFLVVSTWESNETKASTLYRLRSSQKGKFQLEVLQKQPSKSVSTANKNTKTATRSEILGLGYHYSRKYFSYGSTKRSSPGSTVGSSVLDSWWGHAKSVTQTILEHRESMAASSRKVNVHSGAGKPLVKSLVSNNDHSAVAPCPNNGEKKMTVEEQACDNNNGEKKMTLEERVRARSLRNPAIVKSKLSSLMNGDSSQVNDNKTLLELADALRSYSQRRSLVSSGHGGGSGSALDRLKNRGGSGGTVTHATKSIARFPVTDLIKDARMTWSAVVKEGASQSASSGGSKSSRGGATPVVNIDLSRVLFQMRLKMVSVADISDKRQMESQLLDLLVTLATLAPNWIHLRIAPSTLTSTKRPPGKKICDIKGDNRISSKQQDATTANHRLKIRHSIVVIRNDSVDYATEVRAKLGGRVHYSVGSAVKSNSERCTVSSKGRKRLFQQVEEEHQLKNKRPTDATDAIVPPSFRRLYGKALDLDEGSKK